MCISTHIGFLLHSLGTASALGNAHPIGYIHFLGAKLSSNRVYFGINLLPTVPCATALLLVWILNSIDTHARHEGRQPARQPWQENENGPWHAVDVDYVGRPRERVGKMNLWTFNLLLLIWEQYLEWYLAMYWRARPMPGDLAICLALANTLKTD